MVAQYASPESMRRMPWFLDPLQPIIHLLPPVVGLIMKAVSVLCCANCILPLDSVKQVAK